MHVLFFNKIIASDKSQELQESIDLLRSEISQIKMEAQKLSKFLFKISDEKINNLEIPTGNPMIIKFKNDSDIEDAYYLDKERACPIWNLN